MQPSVSYLICATARSGSTLLCEALINTGIAGRPNEYFEALKDTGLPRKPAQYFEGLNNPEIAQILSKLPSVPDTHVYSTRGVTNYADYLAKAIEEGTTPNGVFGAKLTWDSFDDFILHLRQIPAYKEIAVSSLLGTLFPRLHYIWITRRDKVRQAVSLWKAIQMWVWEAREQPLATEAPSEREIVFHYEAIDFLLQQIESYEMAMQQYFDANNIQPFIVIYEDFIAAYEATALKILQYLGIPTPKNLVFAKRTMKRQADVLSEEWVQRYQKNDNRFVEQKNATLIRQYFGTLRLETPEQVNAMNALYDKMWLYYNFFQPVMHLQEKICQGDQVLRHWDQAQTPYQRLIATGMLPIEQQARFHALCEQTNPLALLKEIYRLLAALWDIPSVATSVA